MQSHSRSSGGPCNAGDMTREERKRCGQAHFKGRTQKRDVSPRNNDLGLFQRDYLRASAFHGVCTDAVAVHLSTFTRPHDCINLCTIPSRQRRLSFCVVRSHGKQIEHVSKARLELLLVKALNCDCGGRSNYSLFLRFLLLDKNSFIILLPSD